MNDTKKACAEEAAQALDREEEMLESIRELNELLTDFIVTPGEEEVKEGEWNETL